MALESAGFRFIEFILRPHIELHGMARGIDRPIRVRPASARDVAALEAVATVAFDTGRFALDPRLPGEVNGRRYAAWVRSSLTHPSQELLIAEDASSVVGFFIVERSADVEAYWHLTAVAPSAQGQGVGRRLWGSMLARHAADGIRVVRTRISGHNPRVLNLYASLGFRFEPPEMTYHWVAPESASTTSR
jgi:ribosomal protein S18 acetylase RimI-like enzyme